MAQTAPHGILQRDSDIKCAGFLANFLVMEVLKNVEMMLQLRKDLISQVTEPIEVYLLHNFAKTSCARCTILKQNNKRQ